VLKNARVPVLGIAAWSGTGKTTLLVRVLEQLGDAGYAVGMIKRAHHAFDIDQPGKDSYELRKAGARQMLVASRARTALITERAGERDPGLDELLGMLDQEALDFVLVEGFKTERFPKIELHRPSLGLPLLFPEDPMIVAVATDGLLGVATALPVLDLNRPREVTDFILKYLGRAHPRAERAQEQV
jgi:molybdopterin-guanine dinucleotide biosynthesis protein B